MNDETFCAGVATSIHDTSHIEDEINIVPTQESEPATQAAFALLSDSSCPCPISLSQAPLSFSFSSASEVYDSVHGIINLPPAVAMFLGTNEVQRLRHLLQLGNASSKFLCATHNRLEHSIGVSHCAMELASQIKKNHSDTPTKDFVNFSDTDLWCIGVAGLCHDLGHGPHSHVFESVVNKVYRPSTVSERWCHEEASILLLRNMWEEMRKCVNKVPYTDEDLRFIELIITGIAPDDPWPDDTGRSSSMRWVTDIVNNKRNGLDVDKMDYIQRDAKHALRGDLLLFDRHLIFNSARVLEADGNTYIAYDRKCRDEIETLFQNRTFLYRNLYCQKDVTVVDFMLVDVFRKLGADFKVSCGDRRCTIWECVKSPRDYVYLNDNLFDEVARNGGECARALLNRIHQKNYYTILLEIEASAALTVDEYREFLRKRVDKRVWAQMIQWEKQHELKALDGKCIVISKVSSDENHGKQGLKPICFFDGRSAQSELNSKDNNDKWNVTAEPFCEGEGSSPTFLLLLRAKQFEDAFSYALATKDSGYSNVHDEKNMSSHLILNKRQCIRYSCDGG